MKKRLMPYFKLQSTYSKYAIEMFTNTAQAEYLSSPQHANMENASGLVEAQPSNNKRLLHVPFSSLLNIKLWLTEVANDD